jgi:hypothetical protein
MNAGTCWGKTKIDPSGRCVEKLRKVTLTFNLFTVKLLSDQAFMDASTSVHSISDSSVNVSVFSQMNTSFLIL